MKGSLIALGHVKNAPAAALMVEGQLSDLIIDSDAPRPGTIMRAKVDRLVKGQGGVFLKSPLGSLYLRSAKHLKEGQTVLVQITGYAFEDKAIPVTSSILFKSRYAIITPQKPGWNISRSITEDDRRDTLAQLSVHEMEGSNMGLIIRSHAQNAQDDDIAQDIANMRQIAEKVTQDTSTQPEVLLEGDDAHGFAWREWPQEAQVCSNADAFEACGIWDAIEELRSAHVPLKNGYDYFIEPTRAFVAVDVNTGDDHSKSSGLKATRAVIADLPRQLRLRGLGGQIVIDPAPFPKRDRQQLEHFIKSCFRNDIAETNFIGWTPLGHIELSRQRTRQALTSLL